MFVIAIFALPLAIISWAARVVEQLGVEDPGHSVIHPMGDSLVGAIEAWQSKNGRYPDSLAEAGLTSPTDYHGGFQYERSGEGFILWVGKPDGVNMKHLYIHGRESYAYGGPGWHCMD